MDALSTVYFPTAVALGALHALEPGHAKALTAAYLIGIKGTKRDSVLLGLSVAATHSSVVIGISAFALWLGSEAFAGEATRWLEIASGGLALCIGIWMLQRRIRQRRRGEASEHTHHDHDAMTDDEHARAHSATFPDYVQEGARPSSWQILAFGAAGGMIPCPASITVMLLALSVGKTANGLFAVLGFSLGLAATLVGIGLLVVTGLSRIATNSGKVAWFAKHAPIASAGLVILSGVFALGVALHGSN